MSDKFVFKKSEFLNYINSDKDKNKEKNIRDLLDNSGFSLSDEVNMAESTGFPVNRPVMDGSISTNELSMMGRQNLERVNKNLEPQVETKYVDNAEGYTAKFESESLQSLINEFATDTRYERRGLFGGLKEDSKEMKAVKNNLNQLSNVLMGVVNLENIQTDLENVLNLYRTVITKCNVYLDASFKGHYKVGKLRRSMVERIRATCMREAQILPEIVNSTEESVRKGENAPQSWSDMIRQCRSVHVDHRTSQIEKIGGGTSDLYKIKAQGKTFYFKSDDTLKDHTGQERKDLVANAMNHMVKMEMCKPEDAERAIISTGNLLDAIEEDKSSGIFNDETGYITHLIIRNFAITNKDASDFINNLNGIEDEEKRQQQIRSFLETCKTKVINAYLKKSSEREGINAVRRALEAGTSHSFNLLGEYLRDSLNSVINGDGSYAQALQDALTVAFRDAQSYHIMKEVVKIPEGSKISSNNVVTSRVAEMLGVGDLVAKSESCVITVDGKTMVGNRMEEAKGVAIDDIEAYSTQDKDYLEKHLGDTILRYNKVFKEWTAKRAGIADKMTYGRVKTLLREKLGKDAIPKDISLKDLYVKAITTPGIESNTLERFKKRYEENVADYEELEESRKALLKEYEDIKIKHPKRFSKIKKILGKDKDYDLGMEECRSIYINDVMGDSKNRMFQTTVSGKAKKQLMQLALLDYIMGQTDRKSGNFLVETTKNGAHVNITGIKAIDNDTSAGLLTPDIISRKVFYGCLSAIENVSGDIAVPCIDMNFAEHVLNISIEELKFNLVDLLSKKQIDAMVDRIMHLQDVIKRQYEIAQNTNNTVNYMTFLRTDKDWESYGKNNIQAEKLVMFNRRLFPQRFENGF